MARGGFSFRGSGGCRIFAKFRGFSRFLRFLLDFYGENGV